MRSLEEENPALGWRAIRLGLDRPGLMRSQIRALLRASSGRALKIMFPMVAVVDEFDQAKAMVEHELTHLRRHGHGLPERVEVGVMVEVPSLLFQLDELLPRVDFLSVGSNDLLQFLYAVDRGNARVADRFDPISAPMLRALRDIADKGREHKKPVTLCGEMASKPIGALALVALGYRSLSLTPSAVGPVKAMLLDLDAGKAERDAASPDRQAFRAGVDPPAASKNSPPPKACSCKTMLPEAKLDTLHRPPCRGRSGIVRPARRRRFRASCRANSPNSARLSRR